MSTGLQRTTALPGLNAPVPHSYSHSVRAGAMLFLAGQCGTNAAGNVVSADFEAQARLALDRVRRVVEQAGGTLNDVASMTVFVTDIRDEPRFAEIGRELFGSDYPTSALIGVSALLPPGARVEATPSP